MTSKMALELCHAAELFQILREVSDECILKISKDGWKTNVNDIGDVAAISMEYPPEAFRIFLHDSEQKEVGMDVYAVGEALNAYERHWDELEHNSDGLVHAPYVELEFIWGPEIYPTSQNEVCTLLLKVGSMTERIVMHDPAILRKPLNVPRIDLQGSAKIETGELKIVLERANIINEYVTIGADRGQEEKPIFYIMCDKGEKGLKIDKKPHEIRYDIPFSTTMQKGVASLKSMHSLDYLVPIVNNIRSSRIFIEFDQDFPVKLSFKAGNGNARVQYMLAPRREIT